MATGKYEREFKKELMAPFPYAHQRGAGSMGNADIISARCQAADEKNPPPFASKAFFVEVKTKKWPRDQGDRIYISDSNRTKGQFMEMLELQRAGIASIYAFRPKKNPALRGADVVYKWDIFPLFKYARGYDWPRLDDLPDDIDEWSKYNLPWPVMKFGEGISIEEWLTLFETGEFHVK